MARQMSLSIKRSETTNQSGTPTPPADLLKEIGNEPSSFQWSIPYVREQITALLSEEGISISAFQSILDFGCGLGRFLMAIEPLLSESQRLFGAEVSPGRAQWCQENLPFATVVNNELLPPLPFEVGQFDFIFAMSVFTHLRLDLQFAWATELDRLLMPGGILMFSTHGPSFMPRFLEYHGAGEGKARLVNIGDSGMFLALVFGTETDAVQGQMAVAIAHHPDLIEHLFPSCTLVKYAPRTILAGGQDFFILRKKPNSGLRALSQRCALERRYLWTSPSEKPETFVFELSNVCSTFCCFVAVEVFEDRQIEAVGRIVSEEADTEHVVVLNRNRIFGPNQFLKVELPLAAIGTVEITVAVRGRTSPLSAQVTWLNPVCY